MSRKLGFAWLSAAFMIGLLPSAAAAQDPSGEIEVLTDAEAAESGILLVPDGPPTSVATTVDDDGNTVLVEDFEDFTRYTIEMSASCSITISPGKPYKDPYVRLAIGRVRFEITSGCTGSSQVGTARIQQYTCGTFGCNWKTRDTGSVTVSPGQARTVAMSPTCTGNDTWRTQGGWDKVWRFTSAGPHNRLDCR